MAGVSIPISNVLRETMITVTVTGVRTAQFRLRIAKWVFWLAAKMSGMGIKFEDFDPPDVRGGIGGCVGKTRSEFEN